MPTVTELTQQIASFTKGLDSRSVSRLFDVYMDTDTARPDEAVGAVESLGIVWGSSHPTYSIAKLDSYDVEQQNDNRNHWHVTANYVTRLDIPQEANDTNVDPNQPAPEFRDPLNEPAIESWTSQLLQVAVEKDVNGDAILNYAKRPYDPPPTDWQAVAVYRKQVNKASFNPSDISGYVNRVNSTTFQGFNARQCICMAYNAEKRWRQWRVNEAANFQTTPYWSVSVEIHCIDNADDPSGDASIGPWDLYVLQQDIMQIVSGELAEIVDQNGMPVREPQPIDANGAVVPEANRPGSIVFRGHEIKKTADLNLI